jgi:hypothetical protein
VKGLSEHLDGVLVIIHDQHCGPMQPRNVSQDGPWAGQYSAAPPRSHGGRIQTTRSGPLLAGEPICRPLTRPSWFSYGLTTVAVTDPISGPHMIGG